MSKPTPTPKMRLWSKVMNLPGTDKNGQRTENLKIVIGDDSIKDWLICVDKNAGENLTEEKAATICRAVNCHDELVRYIELNTDCECEHFSDGSTITGLCVRCDLLARCGAKA